MSNTSDTSSVLDTARQAAADVGLDPTKLAHDVSSRIRDAAEAQKSAGAEKVMGVARAIRNAAGDLENDSPEVARYVRSAASSLEGFTRDLNDRSVDDLSQAVVDMARRSPGLFFAGSVLAGFALFRFLNSAQNGGGSSHRPSNSGPRGGQRMGSQGNRSQSNQTGGYGSSAAAPGMPRSSSEGGYGGGGQGATRSASSSSGTSGSTTSTAGSQASTTGAPSPSTHASSSTSSNPSTRGAS